MDRNVHKAWDLNLFALKPVLVSQDQCSMDLEFYWLKKLGHDKALSTGNLSQKPDFPSDLLTGDYDLKFYDTMTDTPLRSGHIITVRTTDPETLPLPSKHLLDMKWHLGRVMAMSAAAIDHRSLLDHAFDDDDDDDDDDGIWYDDSVRSTVGNSNVFTSSPPRNSSDSIDWSPCDSETEVNVESAMEDVVESIEDL
jgi:hypothetical protein